MDRSVIADIPRDKYVERCKQRAFDYLDRGDLKSAVFFIRQQHGCPIRLRVAAPLGRAWCRAVDEQGFTGLEGLDQRDQVIIGLQGQYDISASLSGTRSYIYLAMRLDHGDFRSTPANGRSQDKRASLKGANRRHRACTPLDSFLSEDLKVNTTFLVGERYGRLSSRHSTVDMRRLL